MQMHCLTWSIQRCSWFQLVLDRFPRLGTQISCIFQENGLKDCFFPFFSPAEYEEVQGVLSSAASHPMDFTMEIIPELICFAVQSCANLSVLASF